MPPTVTIETDDDVLRITWNDPDRLNGMMGAGPAFMAKRAPAFVGR